MDIGAQLRTAREAKGLSIGTLAERTRVPARTLAAIERNDQSALPPHPFGRGFVRTYAEELDLDPDRLVRDYFAQFPDAARLQPRSRSARVARPSWQPPSRWMGMATAVAILLVVVAAAVVLGRRSDRTPTARERRHDRHVGGHTSTNRRPASRSPAGRSAGPDRCRNRRASGAGCDYRGPVVTGPCWVAATVDGRRTIYQILQPGERHTLVAEREMTIRFGDAGAVAWTINGRDPGTPGANGAVRDVRVDAANAATVK